MTRGIRVAIGLFVLFASPALGQDMPQAAKAAAPVQAQGIQAPAPEVLLIMIRSALIGLDHANRTGNYSVLREIGGPAMHQHSSGQLSAAFANLRANRIDLLPAAVATPQLTRQPTITEQGMLQLVGYFPTEPRRIEFHIVYQPAGGQWRLAGLNVGISSAPGPQSSVAPMADPKLTRKTDPKTATGESTKAKGVHAAQGAPRGEQVAKP